MGVGSRRRVGRWRCQPTKGDGARRLREFGMHLHVTYSDKQALHCAWRTRTRALSRPGLLQAIGEVRDGEPGARAYDPAKLLGSCQPPGRGHRPDTVPATRIGEARRADVERSARLAECRALCAVRHGHEDARPGAATLPTPVRAARRAHAKLLPRLPSTRDLLYTARSPSASPDAALIAPATT